MHTPHPRAVRWIAAALMTVLCAVGTLAGAGTAAAHATRIAEDPTANAALSQAPTRVSATFNESMQSAFAAMTVVGPDGNLWSTDEVEVQGPVVSVGVRPLGPAGTYTVNYRATSADGHVVSGSWTFELTVGGTGTPGPSAAAPAAQPESGDMPVWPFVLVASLLVGAGALWAARRRT